jgi:hypothetical protein
MNTSMNQRINNVIRTAKSQKWDLATQIEDEDGVLLKFTPAGQLSDPAILPAAMTQLGYALAPFLARVVEYLSPNAGGPAVTFRIPKTIEIVRPQT